MWVGLCGVVGLKMESLNNINSGFIEKEIAIIKKSDEL